MLIVLGGLPATGKTTIARALSRRIRGIHLNLDTIEQALRSSDDAGDTAYRVAYALAEDMLRMGQVVVADSTNPHSATRAAWRDVATRTAVPIVEIEIIRSDSRKDTSYEPWAAPHVVIDTTGRTIDESVAEAVGALQIY
jgi:predicted kinase